MMHPLQKLIGLTFYFVYALVVPTTVLVFTDDPLPEQYLYCFVVPISALVIYLFVRSNLKPAIKKVFWFLKWNNQLKNLWNVDKYTLEHYSSALYNFVINNNLYYKSPEEALILYRLYHSGDDWGYL